MEKAVVYARYSSHNQSEQSIEGQLAAARKYAEVKGYVIVKEYCDRAKTGTNDNREEFQNMLSDCSKKQFSVIIVWKVDRFGRNREEITFNKYRAKKHGVRVEYIAENITDGPEGVILESVLEGMAEYYSLQLSQNVRRGHLESAKKCHSTGGRAPLGYKINEHNEYVIDPVGAETVQLIYNKYEEGYTIADIIKYLNGNGYSNRNGTPFTKNSLPSILSNERYTGTYLFRDIIRVENGIPAIISREQFDRVQEMKKINRRKPSSRWKYSDYLFTNKFFCSTCGSPIIGKSGYGKLHVKYNYYVCIGHTKGKCCRMPIRQDKIEKVVLSEVLNILKDDETLNYIIDLVWDYYQQNDTQSKEMSRLQDKLSAIDSSIKNIVTSIERGMPYEMVSSRIDELRGEKTLYEKLLAEKELANNLRISREDIELFLLGFRDSNITDRECQKRLVKTLVNRIYLREDAVEVILNYSGDGSVLSIENIEKAHNSVRPCTLNQEFTNSRRTLVVENVVLLEIPI